MASSQEYLGFIIGQLNTLNNISYRKMMGEYILYFQGKIFGGIYDDCFFVKITKASRQLMLDKTEELPYDGAKPMLLVDDVDNKEFFISTNYRDVRRASYSKSKIEKEIFKFQFKVGYFKLMLDFIIKIKYHLYMQVTLLGRML